MIKVMSREITKIKVRGLVTKFAANAATYTSGAGAYNETQARTDFITPFLEAFGWNVRNGTNLPEDQRDVIEEATGPARRRRPGPPRWGRTSTPSASATKARAR